MEVWDEGWTVVVQSNYIMFNEVQEKKLSTQGGSRVDNMKYYFFSRSNDAEKKERCS